MLLLFWKHFDRPKVVNLEEFFAAEYKLRSFAIRANKTKVPAQERTILAIVLLVRRRLSSNKL